MRLYEKYRPKTIDDVVGQPKACEQARRIIERGAGGNAIWISGPSGSGKTTLARIIAASIADPFYIEECAAVQLNAERLSDWQRSMRMYSMGKGGRAFIVNEAHGLRAPIQQCLDQLLEEDLPKHVCFIFTTTWDGQEAMFDGIDGGPLLSRCSRIGLTNQGFANAGAVYLQTVAQRENVDGLPLAHYVKLMRDNGNNLRGAMVTLEDGCMIGGAK